MRRLITIPISHYCERARWSLDYCRVDYREDQYLQLLHRFATMPRGFTSTPLLVTDEGAFSDSADIVSYAHDRAPDDRQLYPADPAKMAEIRAFEADVAHRFGIEGRRLVYWHFFRWGRPALAYNDGHTGAVQRLVGRASYPILRNMITKLLNVTDATAARAEERIAPFVEDVAERLADGRPYLFGDEFTAADLTVAALAAPLTMPEGYGVPLPKPEDLPPFIAEMVARYRSTKLGEHALKMYALHRR